MLELIQKLARDSRHLATGQSLSRIWLRGINIETHFGFDLGRVATVDEDRWMGG